MKKYILLWVIMFVLGPTSAWTQSIGCDGNDKYQQLDFWVGDWVVENPSGTVVGRNKIEKILDGCLVLENWKGTSGSKGKSLNFYNRESKKWNQKWIDNSGSPLELEGVVQNDQIVYKGKSLHPSSGQLLFNEMTLKKISGDQVHQLWRQSSDEGASWTVVFDGLYKRETQETK